MPLQRAGNRLVYNDIDCGYCLEVLKFETLLWIEWKKKWLNFISLYIKILVQLIIFIHFRNNIVRQGRMGLFGVDDNYIEFYFPSVWLLCFFNLHVWLLESINTCKIYWSYFPAELNLLEIYWSWCAKTI